MHSKKMIFEYFIKVEKQIYRTIYENIDLDIQSIIEEIRDFINTQNDKNRTYLLTFGNMSENDNIYTYTLSEKVSYRYKPIYKDEINISIIIRSKKIDKLLD